MRRTSGWLILGAVILAVTVISPLFSLAQISPSQQPTVSQAFVAVNNAEAAGATPDEIAPLVALLNEVLKMDQEASRLPANQTLQRNAMLSSINQILGNVTNQANGLTATSAQRTYTRRGIAYVTGLVVAAIGTMAYAFTVEIYKKYRIKRTLQMRIRRR